MARRELAPWSADMEPLVADFLAEAVDRGMSRTAAQAAIRDMGLSMPDRIMGGIWEAANRAHSEVIAETPLSQLRPALEGLTAPTTMQIATDYMFTVKMEGADGRERHLNIVTNDPNRTAESIIAEAMEVANDRSKYAPGTAIPPGGWFGGHIESAWHRGG